MRSALFWNFTQRRLVVSCRRFGTRVGGCEILTAVLVKIQITWDVSPCRLINLLSSSGPAAQDEGSVPLKRPLPFTSRQGAMFDTYVKTSCLTE